MFEALAGVLLVAAALVFRCVSSADREIEVELWQYLAYTGAGFLGIGLVRDVAILLARGRREKPVRAGEKLICFESVSGAFLVASGLALLALDVERRWHPLLSSLGVYAGAVFFASGWTKDVVMVFKREKDHANVIPW